MMFRHSFAAVLAVFLFCSAAAAQRAEVTISLNEAFFDALLDSVYQNFDPPQFSIGKSEFERGDRESSSQKSKGKSQDGAEFLPASFSFANSFSGAFRLGDETPFCDETIKILREMNGVRTAVRFREGRISVPLAFSGDYNPPLVGCVEFGGWADTNIELEFDQAGQRLIGRARVQSVNLNGTGGIGGTIIAKLIQGSIDKKLNPIEILRLDKVSFMIPIQNTGNIRMKAVVVTPEIVNGTLNVRIGYEFFKG